MAIFGKITAVVLVPITMYLFYIICERQSKPYMDEIFHFPQAMKYLHGKYQEWDPKITTPPGLYAVTSGILLPLQRFLGIDVENILSCRAVNILFTLGNIPVSYLIMQKIHFKDVADDILVLSSLNIALLPTVYFFTFLYYTDCGSVFFVLLMYLLHLSHHQWLSSIAGALAILFRQTNIIWMFLVAAHPVYQIVSQKMQKIPAAPKVRSVTTKSRSSNFLRKHRSKLIFYLHYWMPVLSNIIYINIGYLLSAFGFLFFVFVNKSLVLGDKSAHTPGFNIPQAFYFSLYSLSFASPFFVSVPNIKAFLRMLTKYTFLVILVLASIALSVRYLTYEHPYLLSDNTHFTFYIWKRILNRNTYLTHLLMPLGVYSGWTMLQHVKHKDIVWKCLFFICILMSIIPQRLFELRYFNIAFVMLRLHIKLRSIIPVYVEFVFFALVNAVTLYLFLEKPFYDGDVVRRFMW